MLNFSGTFALGTPSNIQGTAISYRCAKFDVFVNFVTILALRGLTSRSWYSFKIINFQLFHKVTNVTQRFLRGSG